MANQSTGNSPAARVSGRVETMAHKVIKARQRLGKYRILAKLGDGGFAAVFKAIDTLEGVPVALKIPHDHLVTEEVLADFRSEVRLAARLKHANILPLKNADFIDGRFVIAYPLGDRTLADRLQSRIALSTVIDYADQMLAAAAYAHEHRVIHCDIKPDNMILFPDGRLMLTDFGIAKIALRTIRASGSGTIGYCAGAGDGQTVLSVGRFFLGVDLVSHAERSLAGMAIWLAAASIRPPSQARASRPGAVDSQGDRERSSQTVLRRGPNARSLSTSETSRDVIPWPTPIGEFA